MRVIVKGRMLRFEVRFLFFSGFDFISFCLGWRFFEIFVLGVLGEVGESWVLVVVV